MRFANPHILWGLLGVMPLMALLWWGMRRRERALLRFAAPALVPHLATNYSRSRIYGKAGLFAVAVCCVIVASARPQWGYEDRHIITRGLDIMVAVDTSLSMLAQDYKPSRLARAKELLQQVIWQAKGDRVGVMAFAGNAFIQCPLTLDYTMARVALETIGPNTVPTPGTAVGLAIDTACKAFEAGSQGERVLILLTDGEDQGSNPIEEAQKAAKAGVRIYTIGIGTTQGVPIPEGNTYKQDKKGRVVNSRLDLDTLRKISALTGGKTIKANERGMAELDVILGDIAGLQKAQKEEEVRRVYTERFQWFLLPAILLLIWEGLETGYTRRLRRWMGRMADA